MSSQILLPYSLNSFVAMTDETMNAYNRHKEFLIKDMIMKCPSIADYLKLFANELHKEQRLRTVVQLEWHGGPGPSASASAGETIHEYEKRISVFIGHYKDKFYCLSIDLNVSMQTKEITLIKTKFYIQRGINDEQDKKLIWIESKIAGTSPLNKIPYPIVIKWFEYKQSLIDFDQSIMNSLLTCLKADLNQDLSIQQTNDINEDREEIIEKKNEIRKLIKKYYYVISDEYIDYMINEISQMLTEKEFKLSYVYISRFHEDQEIENDLAKSNAPTVVDMTDDAEEEDEDDDEKTNDGDDDD